MSARVTVRSSITNPPWSIRLWAMNWRMKSATAGPGQATQPSPMRKRRWRSRGSSASRSCRRQDELDLLAQRLHRVEQPKAGAAHPRRDRGAAEDPGEHPGRRARDLLRDPERQRQPGVDRAAEGDHGVDRPPRAGRRRPGSRTSRPGSSRRGGRRARSPRRPGATASQTATTWSASVRSSPPSSCSGAPKSTTHGSAPPACRTETALDAGRDVVDVGGEHQRRHQEHRGTGRPIGVVVAQAVVAPLGGDLVRRRLLAGLQSAEARDLERVLGGGAETGCRFGDRIG